MEEVRVNAYYTVGDTAQVVEVKEIHEDIATCEIVRSLTLPAVGHMKEVNIADLHPFKGRNIHIFEYGDSLSVSLSVDGQSGSKRENIILPKIGSETYRKAVHAIVDMVLAENKADELKAEGDYLTWVVGR